MKEKVWICRTCGKRFNSERGILQHLVKKSEVLIVFKEDIKAKERLRKRILNEMVIDPHEEKKKVV